MFEHVDLFTCNTYLHNLKLFFFHYVGTLCCANFTTIQVQYRLVAGPVYNYVVEEHISVTFVLKTDRFFASVHFPGIFQVFILTNYFKFLFAEKEFMYFSYITTREKSNFSF